MLQNQRKRILIVDDSAVMRSLLRRVIGTDPELEVIGTASNGESALGMFDTLRPDLALLDVEMPVMDGLATLRKLRALRVRIPVIMCSSLTRRGAAVTIEALAAGASDYVAKPAGQADLAAATQALAKDLLPKIHALTPRKPVLPAALPPMRPIFPPPGTMAVPSTQGPSVVVIGVSTGGPAALDVVLPQLPAAFPLPVLIVQHMPELFTRLLAERLDRGCSLKIAEAAEGDSVHPGTVYIARGNWHLEVLAAAQRGLPPTLHLTQAPPENHCRPAADVLFRSAAAVYGAGVLAVVLTGMGSDGMLGARQIRLQGGTVLAQDEPTSAVWGMPGAVVRAGIAQRVLPVQGIAAEIIRLAGRNANDAASLQETLVS